MPTLATHLAALPWAANIGDFGGAAECKKLDESLQLLAVLAGQLERCEAGNPAMVFVRDLQVQAQHGAACVALGLYRPAAGCIRAMVEAALYYSYFRVHLAELGTLARSTRYYLSKAEVIQFHEQHSADWARRQAALGLTDRLNDWYGRISRVIHGQIPGAWLPSPYAGLTDLRRDPSVEERAADELADGARLVRDLFLVSLAPELWAGFEGSARTAIASGLSKDQRAQLGLSKI